MSAMAASRLRVTSRVLAPGNFSITRKRLGLPSTRASPIRGWWSSITSATSPSRSAGLSCTGTAASCCGVEIGEMCWMARRWFVPSTNPPVPGVDASTKVSGETHSELPAVSMTWVSVTFCARSLAGSTCHLQLPVPLAVDRHVGHPGHAHEPWLELPSREHGHVDQ